MVNLEWETDRISYHNTRDTHAHAHRECFDMRPNRTAARRPQRAGYTCANCGQWLDSINARANWSGCEASMPGTRVQNRAKFVAPWPWSMPQKFDSQLQDSNRTGSEPSQGVRATPLEHGALSHSFTSSAHAPPPQPAAQAQTKPALAASSATQAPARVHIALSIYRAPFTLSIYRAWPTDCS